MNDMLTLSLSRLPVLLIYLLPFQLFLANSFVVISPLAREIAFVAFEFAWVPIFFALGYFRSFTRRIWFVYFFLVCASFVVFMNIVLKSDGDPNVVLAYSSGFRRLAIPFVTFLVLYKLMQRKDIVIRINKAVIGLYWFVLCYQFFDFTAMQISGDYRSLLVALSNVSEEVSDVPLESHIVLFGWQSIRSFGLLINLHGSGLLLMLLFLYKLHLKGSATLTEVIVMGVGVMAGGSLQNFGYLIIVTLLLFGNQQILRKLFAAMLVPLAVVSIWYFSDNSFLHFGTIYYFEYFGILFGVLVEMLSSAELIPDLLFGFGNLRLLTGSWMISGFDLELGDVGFFRIILEAGALVFIFWLLVCFKLGQYRSNLIKFDRLRDKLKTNALFAIPVIGIISLAHYPVLFMPINMTIFMLSLARLYGIQNSPLVSELTYSAAGKPDDFDR